LVTRRKRIKQAEFAQKNFKMSSDPQTDIPSIAAESVQNLGTQDSIDASTLQQAKEIARKLGSFVAHIVRKKVVEAAQKVVDFTEEIQQTADKEVGENLKSQMQVKRLRSCCFRCWCSCKR
jgi:hypothetical protein